MEDLAEEVMRVRADEAYDTCRPTKDWFAAQPSYNKQASKQIKVTTVHTSQWHNPLFFLLIVVFPEHKTIGSM